MVVCLFVVSLCALFWTTLALSMCVCLIVWFVLSCVVLIFTVLGLGFISSIVLLTSWCLCMLVDVVNLVFLAIGLVAYWICLRCGLLVLCC